MFQERRCVILDLYDNIFGEKVALVNIFCKQFAESRQGIKNGEY
jgi:hypothetical protein